MKNGMIAMALAMEELADGQTRIEDEHVFYARIESLDLLAKLASGYEDQEQYEMKSFGAVKSIEPIAAFRVRKTIVSAHVQFALTLKIKQAATGARSETTVDIPEDFFNQFKSVAYRGMSKRRYFLTVPGRPEQWEVDVFGMGEGKYANWVKVDFEFAEGQPRELPNIPDIFLDVVHGNSTSSEEQTFIRSLYEDVFMK